MNRFSSPIARMKSHYGVIVVGSGYGGAIAASRLARAGQEICVLERGKEFQPGEYPDTEAEALSEMQAHTPQRHIGSKTGLYDFHLGGDINAFVGRRRSRGSKLDSIFRRCSKRWASTR